MPLWLLQDPVYFDSVGEESRVGLCTQRGSCGVNPGSAGVSLSGLAKRAALHSPHHTICSKWRGHNRSSDGEKRRGSQGGREPFFTKARWGFICRDSSALASRWICFAFSIRISVVPPLSLKLKIYFKTKTSSLCLCSHKNNITSVQTTIKKLCIFLWGIFISNPLTACKCNCDWT